MLVAALFGPRRSAGRTTSAAAGQPKYLFYDNACVCIYIHIYIYIYVCMYVCMYVCIYIYVYTYIYM